VRLRFRTVYCQVSTEKQRFESLSSEEKKQLAILGNNLAQPISDEDAEQQRLMDAWVDAQQEESK
jgi:hypothetical protein